jgi:hypothetical protein
MYQKNGVHVEDYFINRNFGKNRTKDSAMKINPNDIIRVFFTEQGKPNFEHLVYCEQIAEEIGYEFPSNRKMKTYYRAKFQKWVCEVVNHLIENHGLAIISIKMGHNKRVCYGFSHNLHYLADSVDRRIDRVETITKRKQLAKKATPISALKLLKHTKERPSTKSA